MTFQEELQQLINRHSKENGSDTPDFVLAEYLNNCLTVFEHITNERDKWHGFKNPHLNAAFPIKA